VDELGAAAGVTVGGDTNILFAPDSGNGEAMANVGSGHSRPEDDGDAVKE
jgi:gas vesicle protein